MARGAVGIIGGKNLYSPIAGTGNFQAVKYDKSRLECPLSETLPPLIMKMGILGDIFMMFSCLVRISFLTVYGSKISVRMITREISHFCLLLLDWQLAGTRSKDLSEDTVDFSIDDQTNMLTCHFPVFSLRV